MKPSIEKQNKRRNLLWWQESRLRRLDHKISTNHHWQQGHYVQVPKEEMNRCCDRAAQLANAIQIEWGRRHARAILSQRTCLVDYAKVEQNVASHYALAEVELKALLNR